MIRRFLRLAGLLIPTRMVVLLVVLSVCLLLLPAALGLKAEWIRAVPRPGQDPNIVSRIEPRRSGHVTFSGGGVGGVPPQQHYVFGGYAEVSDDPTSSRHVVNDLWCWDNAGGGGGGAGWQRVDDCTGDLPSARLVAAVATSGNSAYLIGGWDPGVPGTGGTILDTCYQFDLHRHTWTRLQDFPEGPTSRHVAATIRNPRDGTTPMVLVHTHRCQDRVWLLNDDNEKNDGAFFVAQPTHGRAPSPRGLHAACGVGSRLVVFGGAAQDGTMSNQAFVLDAANDWTWTELPMHGGGPVPSPRAAPCLVPYSDDCVILFGGAEATPKGLNPRGDVWALHLRQKRWELLLDDDVTIEEERWNKLPPPRNAATLACIREDNTSKEYLLTGGWHPFVRTWDDCFVLRVWGDDDDNNNNDCDGV